MKLKALCNILLPKAEGRKKVKNGAEFEIKNKEIAKSLLKAGDVEPVDNEASQVQKEARKEIAQEIVNKRVESTKAIRSALGIGDFSGKKEQEEVSLDEEEEKPKKKKKGKRK